MKPRMKPFSFVKSSQNLNGVVQFHLLCGLVIGGFWPMVPAECHDMKYGLSRFIYAQRWLTVRRRWTCVAWQLRVLWFAVGRIVFIEPVGDTLDRLEDLQ